jgi:hypothetical protein
LETKITIYIFNPQGYSLILKGLSQKNVFQQ